MDWRKRSGRGNWKLRLVRGSERNRSISVLKPRRSSNSRGNSSPASEDRRAMELDAKLGIEPQSNWARFRVTHLGGALRASEEPLSAAFLAGVTRLWLGLFTTQNENAGLEVRFRATPGIPGRPNGPEQQWCASHSDF